MNETGIGWHMCRRCAFCYTNAACGCELVLPATDPTEWDKEPTTCAGIRVTGRVLHECRVCRSCRDLAECFKSECGLDIDCFANSQSRSRKISDDLDRPYIYMLSLNVIHD